jgi:hypothetical protein
VLIGSLSPRRRLTKKAPNGFWSATRTSENDNDYQVPFPLTGTIDKLT